MDIDKILGLKALSRLDEILNAQGTNPFRLIIGGGGAMILAHDYPNSSVDLDGMSSHKLDDLTDSIHKVSKELGLSGDWLNSHFQFFTNVLPEDYGNRLVRVFKGLIITAECLGIEDILIMKLIAGRDKDMYHIKFLLSQNGIDLSIVEKRLEELKEIPHTKDQALKALDLFDSLTGDID